MKPPIDTIITAGTKFTFEKLPGFKRAVPQAYRTFTVIRMQIRGPIRHSFNRLAKEVQNLLINEFSLALWGSGGDEAGNAVNHQA